MRTKVFILALIGILFLSCESGCEAEGCFEVVKSEVVNPYGIPHNRASVIDLCSGETYTIQRKMMHGIIYNVGETYCE